MIKKIVVFLLVIITFTSCNERRDQNTPIFTDLNQNWQFSQEGKDSWLPATVPGSVHTDLIDNKIIEDPYYRMNEKQLQWIDKVGWEYKTVFSVDDQLLNRERSELVFGGLDTYAKVYLNGDMLFQADNMFRTWVIDVTGKISKGENELRVLLESPTKKGLEALKEFGFQLAADNDQSENGEMGADRVSPYVRKAPYHFGWDWGPRLVTSGIWRPVLLRAWSVGHIEDINIVTQNLDENEADLIVSIDAVFLQEGNYNIRITCDNKTIFNGTPNPEPGTRNPEPGTWNPEPGTRNPEPGTWNPEPGTRNIEIPIKIDNPILWQPNGYGDQKLYNIKVELVHGNNLIDSKETFIGLRKVRLVQVTDPDQSGRSFYFEVNGKPVFAKGANYIPNDIFLDRVSPEKYEFIVQSAAEANMNMLRVWGGGIYENDIFYDLCDKYGIMVWQDFMFACAMYPGNSEFLESVRLEAVDNVRRLRNHPCIVLWCGNNEIEAAWGPYDENRGWGWKQRYNEAQRAVIWSAYDTLFHHILPAVIRDEDPERSYWHSSPSAGMGELASYETASGDMHYWGVWHGLNPLADFRKYKARFMSEYGFQSFPEFNSVKKYALPEDYNIESEVMMSHQRSGIGNLRIRQYMAEDYKIPADFEQFLYVGQLLQAEAIRLAIESHRADAPYCMGSLYWQINDCWPVASWSGIDYYGRWKALHYFVREAFKPTVLVVAEDNDSLKIKVVSNLKETGNLKLEIRLIDFSGKVEWQSDQGIGLTSREIIFPVEEILGNVDPASVVLVSDLKNGDEILHTDLYYFVKPKDLKLTEPDIKTEITEKGEVIEVVLSSTNLAKNVFLYADGLEGQFSDNYFDILPGKTISVTIPKTELILRKVKLLKNLHLYMTEH